jgi:hypothetical protein
MRGYFMIKGQKVGCRWETMQTKCRQMLIRACAHILNDAMLVLKIPHKKMERKYKRHLLIYYTYWNRLNYPTSEGYTK